MGTSDKALRIVTIAAIASVAAYLGYRAYKKRYPFEESIAKVAPVRPVTSEKESNPIGINLFYVLLLVIRIYP